MYATSADYLDDCPITPEADRKAILAGHGCQVWEYREWCTELGRPFELTISLLEYLGY